jgi:phosphomevalonate kinase
MISAKAPGKAVIWGEYAVLAGAPAMVMAVDRYAECQIEPGGEVWSCQALGFNDQVEVSADQLLSASVPMHGAAAPIAVASQTLELTSIPAGARVQLDSRAFFAESHPDRKLGIGSSAAICTAACAAMAELSGNSLSFEQALHAHRQMQQAQGSGIDVAAAYYGGVLRFSEGKATPTQWPQALCYRFIWTGVSAKTTSHLQTFSQWRSAGDTRALDNLANACAALFVQADMDSLRDYVEQLKKLDRTAGLGIYSEPHKQLDRLAIEHQLVYKPCGAGGGDIGIVFGNLEQHQNHLDLFTQTARRQAFHPLALEIAAHGIRPTR